MYCLVLCSGVAGMHPTFFFLPHQDLHAKIATVPARFDKKMRDGAGEMQTVTILFL